MAYTTVPWLFFGTNIKKRFSRELTHSVNALKTQLTFSKKNIFFNFLSLSLIISPRNFIFYRMFIFIIMT